ncbi:hypothetical protein NFHSH190041_08210 [Shewanella sp. NFH-SH190041]|nr:hypothetical protein NFHSH190041_08210 [Shewanella sp. NFH-SH190041]
MKRVWQGGFTLMLVVMSWMCQAGTLSDDMEIAQLKQKVNTLQQDVALLRQEVLQLKNLLLSQRGGNATHQWGCYLDDIRAGGVYGTGNSEAEAKGKTLAQCHKKGGVCWESSLKCSLGN